MGVIEPCMIDSGLVELPFVTTSGEVSRGEKIALRETGPESYVTEYTVVYEDNPAPVHLKSQLHRQLLTRGVD